MLKDFDEFSKKLKHNLNESEEDQANTIKIIKTFRAENETTKEAIGIEAIYQERYLSYKNNVLKININDCEKDIDNFEQQNAYLEIVLNEYKKTNGELKELHLNEFKTVF